MRWKRWGGGVREPKTFPGARKGNALTPAIRGRRIAQVTAIGILVAILSAILFAATSCDLDGRGTSIGSNPWSNDVRQISMSLMCYESAHGAFPARASFDKTGKPLLSWRVHMLPYLDQQALYKEFHLDEPWDSPHNRKLIPRVPEIFQKPGGSVQPGRTIYLAVCGKGLMFEGSKERKIAEITDGAANTIMLLEANDDRAVVWTQPEDWQYDPEHPLAGLGAAHPAGFWVACADGEVRFIPRDVDPQFFEAMLTIASGERHGDIDHPPRSEKASGKSPVKAGRE